MLSGNFSALREGSVRAGAKRKTKITRPRIAIYEDNFLRLALNTFQNHVCISDLMGTVTFFR